LRTIADRGPLLAPLYHAIRLKGERDEEWRAARFECFAERSSGRV
jgi:hypothetical protein